MAGPIIKEDSLKVGKELRRCLLMTNRNTLVV